MSHPVTWFQISGQDGKKLQSFYKKVFAWSMSPAPGAGSLAMVEPEQGGIAGGVGPNPNGSANGVSVYVTVQDLAGHLKKIEKAGGKTVQQPSELPGNMGSVAGFTDPAGNFVGLWQPPATPAEPKAKAAAKSKNGAKASNGTAATKAKAAPAAKTEKAPAKPAKAPAKAAKKAKSKR